MRYQVTTVRVSALMVWVLGFGVVVISSSRVKGVGPSKWKCIRNMNALMGFIGRYW